MFLQVDGMLINQDEIFTIYFKERTEDDKYSHRYNPVECNTVNVYTGKYITHMIIVPRNENNDNLDFELKYIESGRTSEEKDIREWKVKNLRSFLLQHLHRESIVLDTNTGELEVL